MIGLKQQKKEEVFRNQLLNNIMYELIINSDEYKIFPTFKEKNAVI